jgi:hypothetical protein
MVKMASFLAGYGAYAIIPTLEDEVGGWRI